MLPGFSGEENAFKGEERILCPSLSSYLYNERQKVEKLSFGIGPSMACLNFANLFAGVFFPPLKLAKRDNCAKQWSLLSKKGYTILIVADTVTQIT